MYGFFSPPLVEMSEMFATYRDDEILGPAVAAMEVKFKKHWAEIPFLYVLGVVLDHMIKLSSL